MGLYKRMNQKRTNQKVYLNLNFFVLTIISVNRMKEIIRRFRGSKKKLNVFETIKNKWLALHTKLIGKFFEGLKSFKKLVTVAGQNLC